MWPFNPSNESEDEDWVTKAVPVTTLARWYIYDMDAKNTNKLAVELDLTPVSEEGDEKERQDSDIRVDRVMALGAFFATMAEINAKAIMQVQKSELPPQVQVAFEKHSHELEQLLYFYQSMSYAAIFSAFSSAAELGLVEISGRFTSTETDEE